jgi:FKBP-type peptidyl-prolyl cis-trans isomerase FkpA
VTQPRHGAFYGVLAGLFVAVVAACSDPTGVEFEVITEVEFADTLDIDLATFTETPSGVWIKDVVVGTGDTAQIVGDTLYVTYTVWLRDGTVLDDGEYQFTFGLGGVIQGWHYAMLDQRVGGTRRAIIPPELAYGEQSNPPLYPGAVLVFNLQLDSIHPWVGP